MAKDPLRARGLVANRSSEGRAQRSVRSDVPPRVQEPAASLFKGDAGDSRITERYGNTKGSEETFRP